MLNMQEIEEEINRLESGKMTYSSLEKLSVLYSVKNQNAEHEYSGKSYEKPMYSYKATPDSEFLEAVHDVPLDDLMEILNEHMEAVKVVFPKEYNMVIRKIEEKTL